MSLLKKFFGAKPAPRPVNEMSFEEAWAEFKRLVPYRDGKMLIAVLHEPANRAALTWLSPPCECPMAKSLVRGLVDCFRQPGPLPDNLAVVYQPESEEKWSIPPDASLQGLSNFVGITGIVAEVFYKETPNSEYTKLVIRPVE